jgi:pSer/pThr/pTyr-binding forkhead associated (FHA) protein
MEVFWPVFWGLAMSARVKVTIKDRLLPAREFVFGNRTVCTVGRAHDCYLQMPGDLLHRNISRHHCLLDIDPPAVRVRDLGSRNGTYVNGKKIGQRLPEATPEDTPPPDNEQPELAVFPGDTIQLGDTMLEVTICPAEEATKGSDGNEGRHVGRAAWTRPLSDWNI